VKWLQQQSPRRGLATFSYRPNVKVEYLDLYFIFRLLIWDPMYRSSKKKFEPIYIFSQKRRRKVVIEFLFWKTNSPQKVFKRLQGLKEKIKRQWPMVQDIEIAHDQNVAKIFQ
jgi:hypothetical protein